MDIHASQFREEEPYKYMEMPSAPQQPAGGHADRVLDKNGNLIGVSSCAIYSAYYRKTISHCTLDLTEAEIGNEVIIEWGDFGEKQRAQSKLCPPPYGKFVVKKEAL